MREARQQNAAAQHDEHHHMPSNSLAMVSKVIQGHTWLLF